MKLLASENLVCSGGMRYNFAVLYQRRGWGCVGASAIKTVGREHDEGAAFMFTRAIDHYVNLLCLVSSLAMLFSSQNLGAPLANDAGANPLDRHIFWMDRSVRSRSVFAGRQSASAATIR